MLSLCTVVVVVVVAVVMYFFVVVFMYCFCCCCHLVLLFFLLALLLLLLLCVYLIGGQGRPDLSVDLSLTKSFIKTLVGRHGNGQNRAVGVTKLRAIGQLREYCVLIGQRDREQNFTLKESFLFLRIIFFNSGNCKIG